MAFGTSGLNEENALTGERPCEHSEEISVEKQKWKMSFKVV